eukprot:3659435-Pleurochrysis_carterae.AAC.1
MLAIMFWCGMAVRTLPRTGASMVSPLSGVSEWYEYCPLQDGAVQIDPAGTGTQPYGSMRLCKKAPQD